MTGELGHGATYAHCRRCIEERRVPPNISVRFLNDKIQVWCRTHDIDIATLKLVPGQIPKHHCDHCNKLRAEPGDQ